MVERRSLTGELSLVCTGPAADAADLQLQYNYFSVLFKIAFILTIRCRSANKANSTFHPHGVD